jgi:hypothetical protein
MLTSLFVDCRSVRKSLTQLIILGGIPNELSYITSNWWSIKSKLFLKSSRINLPRAPLPSVACFRNGIYYTKGHVWLMTWAQLVPNCLVSTTLRTAGLINCMTTTSSASFEIIGVNEVGLRTLLLIRTGFCFGRVVTSTNFQEEGNRFSW